MAEQSDREIRGDLNLFAQALRNDWPIPQKVKTRLLQVAVNIADPTDDEKPDATESESESESGSDSAVADPPAKVSYRTRLAALRVVGMFSRLSLEQQRLDLLRDKLDGSAKGFVLADAVAEAIEAEAAYTPDTKPA